MKNSSQLALAVMSVSVMLAGTACSQKAAASGSGGFEFTTVSRGSIEKTVSGSGTLQPVETVNVLAQMSGTVEKIYADNNDSIAKGQTLAELNTDMLKLERQERQAAVLKAKANFALQETNYRNQQKLRDKELISEYELLSGKTALDSCAADLSSAEAALSVVDTKISQYAFIKSPITGIVLERNVNVGDSVSSGSGSLSSSLFTLARDLSQMEIEASVDELDIAYIKQGQLARFSVEAMPGKTYTGTVRKIHLMPDTSNNVVSYTVIVAVDNSGGALLPGMTADVEFIEKRSDNVLTVPNAALRFEPASLTGEEIAALKFNAGLSGLSDEERSSAIAAREAALQASASKKPNGSSGLGGLVMGGPGIPGNPGRTGGTSRNGRSQAPGGSNGLAGPAPGGTALNGSSGAKYLWYVDGQGKLAVIQVRALVSDGTITEIESGADIEGMRIILREKIQK